MSRSTPSRDRPWGGKPLDTPHLHLSYQAADFARFRESGASWKQITVDVPQPTEFIPGDARLTKRS